MANYNLSVKVSKGQAKAHAKYVLAEGKYAYKKEELELAGFGNLPKWAENDPMKFWGECEKRERINGSRYREHVISLPRELTKEERKELVNEWIKEQIGDSHAYTFAIHNTVAQDGLEHPHLHLMFSDRVQDEHERAAETYFKRYNSKHPERGGCKKANSGMSRQEMRNKLIETRKAWADLGNKHLIRAGHEPTLDHRNWQERGAEQPPRNKSMLELKTEKELQKYFEQNYQEIENATRKYELIPIQIISMPCLKTEAKNQNATISSDTIEHKVIPLSTKPRIKQQQLAELRHETSWLHYAKNKDKQKDSTTPQATPQINYQEEFEIYVKRDTHEVYELTDEELLKIYGSKYKNIIQHLEKDTVAFSEFIEKLRANDLVQLEKNIIAVQESYKQADEIPIPTPEPKPEPKPEPAPEPSKSSSYGMGM